MPADSPVVVLHGGKMTAILAAFCVGLVFIGGGWVGQGHVAYGLGLTSLGSIGLGTLFAAFQAKAEHVEQFDTREGLSLRQLIRYTCDQGVDLDAKVYVGDDRGMNIAGGCFACIYDGGKAFVIERPIEESVAVPRDLF
jgi:hypothetical protein